MTCLQGSSLQGNSDECGKLSLSSKQSAMIFPTLNIYPRNSSSLRLINIGTTKLTTIGSSIASSIIAFTLLLSGDGFSDFDPFVNDGTEGSRDSNPGSKLK